MWRVMQLVVGIIVVVVASAGVAWGARRYMLTSPRFAIRTVVVEGTERLTPDEIAKAGAIEVGKNVFALDLEHARAAIEQSPWVQEAKVVRRLPSAVDVVVVEHRPAALVAIAGETLLATRDGAMFKSLESGDPVDLPVITGLAAELAVADRVGAEESIRQALDAADQINEVGISDRYPLQEIHLEADGNLTAVIGTEAISLHLGPPPYKAKVVQARRVLDELRARKGKPAVVFLDNEANPDRVVVRMR